MTTPHRDRSVDKGCSQDGRRALPVMGRLSLGLLSLCLFSWGLLSLKTAFAGPERRLPPGAEQRYAAAASASASVSALPPEPVPEEKDGHKPWLPAFEGAFPTAASDKPSKEDWESAKVAREARVTEPDCAVYRIREWYKVECGSVRFERISGDIKNVDIGCIKIDAKSPFCSSASLIFPARRGDVRIFTKYISGKWGPRADSIVSFQFLEGDPFPLIAVEGIRWGF